MGKARAIALFLAAALTSTAQAADPKFSCSLDSPKGLTPFLLVQDESHGSDDSRRIEVGASNLAKTGKIYLGLEGTFVDEKPSGGSKVFGLERALSRGLGISYNARDLEVKEHPFGIRVIADELGRNSYMREAWRLAREANGAKWPPPLAAAAAALDRAVESRSTDSLAATDRRIWIILIEEMNEQYVKSVNASHLRELGLDLPLSSILDGPQPSLGKTNLQDSYWASAVDVRSRDMAAESANLYCQALADGKPFVAFIGALHAEDVVNMIARASGNKVRLRLISSSAPDAVLAEITKAAQAARVP